MVLSFDIVIRRTLYGQDVENAIVSYQKELEEFSELLRRRSYDFAELCGNGDLIKKTQAAVEMEIRFCQFHRLYKEMSTMPGFKQWVFTSGAEAYESDKKEGHVDNWNPSRYHDFWTRSNGKTKAIIEIDAVSGPMTKISMRIENEPMLRASRPLLTLDRMMSCDIEFVKDTEGTDTSNLKNAASIEQRINTLKFKAEELQGRYLMPYYLKERNNLDNLKIIMHAD